ncbi:hypothetical protein [Sandarakinorhabdus sp.]|uniref:hypothetical protein n=1 Tax=Sandarakinorhabdus sp. TaxID=1916663 RepID=UPI00333E5A15
MHDVMTSPPPRRWPWYVAIAASLVWTAAIAAGWAVYTGQIVLDAAAMPLIIAGLAALAPLAVILLAMLHLRDAGAIAAIRAETAHTRSQLAAIDIDRSAAALARLEAQLDTTANRLADLARPIAGHNAALAAAAAALETGNTQLAGTVAAAVTASGAVAGTVPAATAQAEALIALLDRADNQLRGQLADTETLLASLYTRASEADAEARAAADTSRAGLDAMAAAASRAHSAVAEPLAELNSALDTAFTRTASAVDVARDAVHVHSSAMLASLDQARTTLAHIGGDAARAVDERLVQLQALAASIAAEIAAAGQNTTALVTDLGSRVEALEQRLGAAVTASADAVGTLDARLISAAANADALAAPISASAAALADVQARLDAMAQAASQTAALIEKRLPANAPLLTALGSQMAALQADALALLAPIEAGSNTIDAATDRLALARETLAASSTDLAAAIAAAQAQLRDMENSASRLALTTSGELIDSFGRVREVAQAAAGQMKAALQGVVAEAEAALNRAAIDTAETAFARPIRLRIDELVAAQGRAGDSAQVAAERVAQRLVALTRTISEVEAHVDAVETRADVRARNALGRRANALIDTLQSSAVDLAKLLAFDIDDQAWRDYAAGDRSAIARRLATGLDHGTGRQFVRHFSHDTEFRNEASRFLNEFEALVSEIVPDRGGEALGATLLSSTYGKLYLAIGQAAGRFN